MRSQISKLPLLCYEPDRAPYFDTNKPSVRDWLRKRYPIAFTGVYRVQQTAHLNKRCTAEHYASTQG